MVESYSKTKTMMPIIYGLIQLSWSGHKFVTIDGVPICILIRHKRAFQGLLMGKNGLLFSNTMNIVCSFFYSGNFSIRFWRQ